MEKTVLNHTKSFRNKHYKNETSLGRSIWKIKKKTGQIATLTWSVVRKVPAYSSTTNKCALCLHDKLESLMNPNSEL